MHLPGEHVDVGMDHAPFDPSEIDSAHVEQVRAAPKRKPECFSQDPEITSQWPDRPVFQAAPPMEGTRAILTGCP